MFRGTINAAEVHPREIVKECLWRNAAAVVLAHNHPSGFAVPSDADRHITRRIQQALSLIDVRVLDHIIVADANVWFSMADHNITPRANHRDSATNQFIAHPLTGSELLKTHWSVDPWYMTAKALAHRQNTLRKARSPPLTKYSQPNPARHLLTCFCAQI